MEARGGVEGRALIQGKVKRRPYVLRVEENYA